MFIRFFDFVISLVAIIILIPIFFVLTVICFFDTGNPIFFQTRIGKNERLFTIIKFRTMITTNNYMPTHLVDKRSITNLGFFLRKYKLDELPQLINVLIGNMSLVGPRPCLISQKDLILKRRLHDIFSINPGITGPAQLSGVDMSNIDTLINLEKEMTNSLNFWGYSKYIWITSIKFFSFKSFD